MPQNWPEPVEGRLIQSYIVYDRRVAGATGLRKVRGEEGELLENEIDKDAGAGQNPSNRIQKKLPPP
jgi:hypothetical protein